MSNQPTITPKRIIYGESNYAAIVDKNGYFVDKTAYIAKLLDEDTAQIQGHAHGLRQEYPTAQIELFVIYCFGNQGFRVFAIPPNDKDYYLL